MRKAIKRLLSDEGGGPLAEFAVVIGLLFMFTIFVFEISRFYMRSAMGEYATQLAVRMAAVRPAVCPGVPDINEPAVGSTSPFGTMCSDPSGPCSVPPTQTCAGLAGNPAVDEIFGMIQPLLPAGATPANLQFQYEATGLGFLGGPYVPMTSVSLQGLQHQFILPLGQLFAPWSGGTGGGNGNVPLGPMTATMSGEDLNTGTGG